MPGFKDADSITTLLNKRKGVYVYRNAYKDEISVELKSDGKGEFAILRTASRYSATCE